MSGKTNIIESTTFKYPPLISKRLSDDDGIN